MPTDSQKTKKKTKEPDWQAIAWKLAKKVNFALANLKPKSGTGLIMTGSPGDKEYGLKHWKEEFADALELYPGVEVDREAMHACDLPKKERDKFFKDREAKKKTT